MKLKRKSWHGYFAGRVLGSYELSRTQNFCDYFWAVVRGAIDWACMGLLMLAGFAIAVTILFTMGDALYWYASMLYRWQLTQANDFQVFGTVIWILGSAVIFEVCRTTKPRRRERKEKEPGFIKLAYRSFKDKVCGKIDLE